MTVRTGTVLRGDCGAMVVYLQPCPDAEPAPVVCACGGEMVPTGEPAGSPVGVDEVPVPGRARQSRRNSQATPQPAR